MPNVDKYLKNGHERIGFVERSCGARYTTFVEFFDESYWLQ